jgi:hypothetical protein
LNASDGLIKSKLIAEALQASGKHAQFEHIGGANRRVDGTPDFAIEGFVVVV